MTHPSIIHFGKYRGRLWSDVPAHYLNWIVATFEDGRIKDAANASLNGQKVPQRPAKCVRKRLEKKRSKSREKPHRERTPDACHYLSEIDQEFAAIVTGDTMASLTAPVDPTLVAPWEGKDSREVSSMRSRLAGIASGSRART